MSKQIIKTAFASLGAAALLVSCGPALNNLKNEPLKNDVSQMTQKKGQLDKNELKAWPHMDMISDTIPGISAKKAYEEIIKNHEGKKVIVGILDSGVDIHHEDLADVIWTNEKEIAGNGKDDDNNGYIDDIHGWNFLGDAVHDNLEYVRILKKLKPKYDGKKEEDIAEADLEEYKVYLAAKKEYEEEKGEADQVIKQINQNKGQYEQTKTMLVGAIDLLKKEVKKDNLKIEDIKAIDSDDTDVTQAQSMLTNMMMQVGAENTKEIIDELGEASEQMEGALEYYNDKLKYHLNLDYNGREIVGDNPDDLKDVPYGNDDVTGPTKDKEDILHGTHVAGIVAAVRNNDIGMDGVAANVEIMPIRAVPDGDEYDKDIALGIRYAVDNGAKVINMSFGKYFSPHPEWVNEAMKYAAKHDVLLVKAAGNESKDLDVTRVYPNDQWPDHEEEITDNVIVVGALSPSYGEKLVAPFSNYGKKSVDVFAPGMQIWATTPLDKYKFLQGTSMAAPEVAGIAAVIRSYFPKLTAAQVKQVIMDSGITSDQEVVLGEKQDIKRPFKEASVSGRMANLYNALIMASKL